MANFDVIMPPGVKPDIQIDPATSLQLLSSVSEESQVILHCYYTGAFVEDNIRIWKSTFLFPHECHQKSQLITVHNITLYPQWMTVLQGETIVFTLVFSALPRECKVFDMIESIPEPGGFEVKNIQRNKIDVYHIRLK